MRFNTMTIYEMDKNQLLKLVEDLYQELDNTQAVLWELEMGKKKISFELMEAAQEYFDALERGEDEETIQKLQKEYLELRQKELFNVSVPSQYC